MGLKLGLAFAVLVSMLVAGSGWSYVTVDRVQQSYNRILDTLVPVSLAAQSLNAEIQTQAQLIMNYAATRENRLDPVLKSRDRATGHLERLSREGKQNAELRQAVGDIETQLQTFYRLTDGLFNAGKDLSNQQLVLQADNARAVGEVLGRSVNDLVRKLQTQMQQGRTASERAAATAVQALLIAMLIGTIVATAVGILVIRAIVRPIRTITGQMQDISAGGGDLRRQLRVNSNDEIGDLAASFNSLVAGLAAMVRRIGAAGQELYQRSRLMQETSSEVAAAVQSVSSAMMQVAAGATQQSDQARNANEVMGALSEAIEQIARGAGQQANQVQRTAAIVADMVTAMEAMASSAQVAADESHSAARTAEQGAGIVDDTLARMEDVRQGVQSTARQVAELGEHGSRIGEIMKVITDIAEQTNLLALNAAIEAARAGEQGRGFAVVAEEVRRLANRARTSAGEIAALIKDIQRGTEAVVASIQERIREVEENAQVAASAGQALSSILASAERVNAGVRQIAAAVGRVQQQSHQVADTVGEVAAVTEENSAATEEMAAGATQVREVIGTVNSVSDENSTSVRSAAASVEQVNTSVDRVAQAAHEVSGIAGTLQELVGQFRV